MSKKLTAEFRFRGLKNENEAKIDLYIAPGEWHGFGMTKEDIESNMLKFGDHPELMDALDALEALSA